MSGKNPTVENRTYRQNSVLRLALAAFAIVLQILIIVLMVAFLGRYATWLEVVIQIVAMLLVIRIYAQEKTAAMKMPWIVLILVLPVMGISLYYLVGGNIGLYMVRRKYNRADMALLDYRHDDSAVLEEILETDKDIYGISRYISDCSKYPVYKNTDVKYFGDTSAALERMLFDISHAKEFIFMEYFAIENNQVWDRVTAALEERVKSGVKVRVLYDDVGSGRYVSRDFPQIMKKKGIDCMVFNRVGVFLNMFMNNRDHRKITVIDGQVGYTGGFNMADEYFNITHPYGRWKDAGIRIEGSAVNSLTAAFLEMRNTQINEKNRRDADISEYLKALPFSGAPSKAFVQPYADSPLDSRRIGEDVYLSMIDKAKDYCYFMTPYLIITDEMIRALRLSAKRGVDVRIIVPGIPDKKMIFSVTRSFYNALVLDGVKIYEWTPGFVHAKLCLVDGKMAICGSINLDYRSLYHHFEFGCFFNDKNVLTDMEKDFDKTFAESKNVSVKYQNVRYSKSFGQRFLRLFAELL